MSLPYSEKVEEGKFASSIISNDSVLFNCVTASFS